jgi:hypothetical protein
MQIEIQNQSVDFSKIGVCIKFEEAYEQEHDDPIDDIKELLKKQIENPHCYIEKHVDDGFGHTYIRGGNNKREYHIWSKKWKEIEFLITCNFFDRSIHGEPASIQDFQLYKVKIKDGELTDLIETKEVLPEYRLEGLLYEKLDDDDFELAILDNGLSLYLLEDIMPDVEN